MDTLHTENPLLGPIQLSFDIKRNKKTGLVPRNWLLIILRILDRIRVNDVPLIEDDIYTYDYTLKNSRSTAIPKLLSKYGLPTDLHMSGEGVTVRGAPGLRVFRAIEGGGLIMHFPKARREAVILEAVEAIRAELMRFFAEKSVTLPAHEFDQSGTFVVALLKAVENRSNGRVEQALVGAKLELRFGEGKVPVMATFAGDQQTGRECDYEVENSRVIVSVSPKDNHFLSAWSLADAGRRVTLVVGEKAVSAANKRIRDRGYVGKVSALSVVDYVTTNMNEIEITRGLTSRQMCMELVAEYNRRIASDFDRSLQVTVPV